MNDGKSTFHQNLGARAAQLLMIATLSYLVLSWYYTLYPALYTCLGALSGYSLALLLYRLDHSKTAARAMLLTLLSATFFITNYVSPSTGIGHLYFILTALIVVILDLKKQRLELSVFLALTVVCLALGFVYEHNFFGMQNVDLPVGVVRYGGAITSGSAILVVAGLLILFIERARRLSDSQAKLIEELHHASSAKSAFLANMSHEIRTPLNGIFGSLQIIRSNLNDQDTVARYTGIGMQSYHSVIGIVNDILDLSKLNESKVELYPEPSNVEEIVKLVTSELSAVAMNKGIELTSFSSPATWTENRLIDRTRLAQVLRNLVSNAIKFTSSGAVHLEAQTGEQSGEVVFTVSDTGAGIPEDKLDSIFEPFEQADASRVVERSGTGLGLPITKQLAELMGGGIRVSSLLGKGSRFEVRVSLPITSMPRADQKSAINIAELQPAKILLAEDVMTNRMIFGALLKGLPYEIDEAENGELAVEKALKSEYDLVFLDIQMPVMDGLSALAALRVANYDKPVIACTANVMKEDIEEYLGAGFDSVIGKPYLKEDLVANIQASVTRASLSKSIRGL